MILKLLFNPPPFRMRRKQYLSMVIKKVIESEIVPYDTLQAEPFLTVHMLKRLCLQGDLTIVCSITKRRGMFKDHGKQFQADSGANSLLCIRHV